MSAVAPVPFTMNASKIQIGTNTFELGTSKCVFTPSVSVNTYKGIGGAAAVYSAPTLATWTLDLTALQDIATATSLQNLLLASAGTTVTAIFTPVVGTGAKIVTASVILAPGAIGGSVDDYADFSVSLGVVGAPVISTGP